MKYSKKKENPKLELKRNFQVNRLLDTNIYFIKRLVKISVYQAARMYYFFKFHSLLQYCNLFWRNATDARY